MTDRRTTPANARVAHVSLRGQVSAPRYVEGEMAAVALPLADLTDAPDGARERQVLMGDRVLVLDRQDGWAFVRADKDGYCGYLATDALGPDTVATHRVGAVATHLYPAPDFKQRESARLSFGARLVVVEDGARFARTGGGKFVPKAHLRAVSSLDSDPAGIAQLFLGTPYLWGGNSRDGLDCSGLVQAALLACGVACPGDSDQQEASVGAVLPPGASIRRGDLLFWAGHVAMALSADRLIHANAGTMSVAEEPIPAARARIEQGGDGPLRTIRRP